MFGEGILFETITWFAFLFFFIEIGWIFGKRFNQGKGRVGVVVLGDIGRSPRTQYHAISLSQNDFAVDLIGYKESNTHPLIRGNPNIQVKGLLPVPKFINKFPKLLIYFLKVIWQSLTLFIILLHSQKPSHLIMQNPPSIPTLLICLIICKLQNTKFIIDWHNFGYSIMALNLNKSHPLVKFAKRYECLLGKYSDENFCVTKAMKNFLNDQWGIKSTVLYDKPHDNFGKAKVEEWHEIFLKYKELNGGNCEESKFTKINVQGQVELKSDRPVLIVSSTSWTEDEDFSLLFDAMKEYDAEDNLPRALCVVTGKGPEKEKYVRLIKEHPFKNVEWSFPWLEPEDYPVLIGSADLGICLHMSSSNLDLPMKVLDMFGCEVPVLAVKYDCINELVEENKNGLLFDTSQELAANIKTVFRGFPNNCDRLNAFQKNLRNYPKWNSNWNSIALPFFKK